MKIRLDFVTNSSSASFVCYKIKPGKDKERFVELWILLERLCNKYQQRYVMDTYHGRGELEFYENAEIMFEIWSSEPYRFPSSVTVALSALFGKEGREYHYLHRLNKMELKDADGNINKNLVTDLTDKELLRLEELLNEVKVKSTSVKGGTD